MLMVSGANFGFCRTLPHMLRIGLGPLSRASALSCVEDCRRFLDNGYRQTGPSIDLSRGRRVSMGQSQWLGHGAERNLCLHPQPVLSGCCGGGGGVRGANLPCVSTWTVLGQQMTRWLTNPKRMAAFNWTMAWSCASCLRLYVGFSGTHTSVRRSRGATSFGVFRYTSIEVLLAASRPDVCIQSP